MSNNDNLAACLSKINNSEKVVKSEIIISGISKEKKKILTILQENNYIGAVEYLEDSRGGKIKIELINKINNVGAIKPRFNVKITDIERFEKRYLPARGFGVMIISTSKGMITNNEAKEKKIGGKLIAFCY